jgi:hypothetical protein
MSRPHGTHIHPPNKNALGNSPHCVVEIGVASKGIFFSRRQYLIVYLLHCSRDYNNNKITFFFCRWVLYLDVFSSYYNGQANNIFIIRRYNKFKWAVTAAGPYAYIYTYVYEGA